MFSSVCQNHCKMKCVNIVVIVVLSFFARSDAACNKLYGRGVLSNEQNTIVNRHNAIRLDIANGRVPGQPKSSNMKRLLWDATLAARAQNIAETCVFGHVKVSDPRFAVGQNLYWSASTVNNITADWVAGIDAWFNEYKTYHFGTTTYNHYTQEVWANTNLVGCGYTYYQNRPGWYEKLYVCNYGPAGNYVGQTPYNVGAGCENLC